MIENIFGVEVMGGCFGGGAKFDLFEKNKKGLAIVFGRNGVGKSSLAKALSGCHPDIKVSRYLGDGVAALPVQGALKTFVFDEDFVDQNVRFASELEPVVLLGEQGDLVAEIDALEEESKRIDAEIKKANDELVFLQGENNKGSPGYYKKEIKRTLEQSDWVSKEKLYKGVYNGRVHDSLIDKLSRIDASSLPDAEVLRKAFEEKLFDFRMSANIPEGVLNALPEISLEEGLDSKIVGCLGKAVKKQELSPREAEIVALIEKGVHRSFEAAREKFKEKGFDVCPYCFRELTNEYKANVLQSLGKILNREVDEFRDLLLSIKIPDFDLSFDPYRILDSGLVSEAELAQREYQEKAERYRDALQEKKSKIFSVVQLESLDIERSFGRLKLAIDALKVRREEVLGAVNRREELKGELDALNLNLACLSSGFLVARMMEAKQRISDLKDRLASFDQEKAACKESLSQLRSRQSNLQIAVDRMNAFLRNIFYEKDRLVVEPYEGKYRVRSRGKYLSSKNISVGERNALALSYFFVKINENKKMSDFYRDECLLVLDDPLSSFDFENKLGVYSLLFSQLDGLLRANKNSKAIVLTHSVMAVADFMSPFPKDKFSYLEMSRAGVKEFDLRLVQYGRLLQEVAKYACGDDDSLEMSIGNTLRRALEAFSTFMYNKGIWFNNSELVWKRLGGRSEYFRQMVHRVLLNNESHTQNMVWAMHDDFVSFEFASKEEKRRICRDVLAMMFALNDGHVEAYLEKDFDKIKGWLVEIPINQVNQKGD